MGPPFVTAEVTATRTAEHSSPSRFNGAAVRDGGSPEQGLERAPEGSGAPMGPPFVTAEVRAKRKRKRSCLRSFNGAAVRDGGSRWHGSSSSSGWSQASMGPPFVTAEVIKLAGHRCVFRVE